MSLRQEDLVSIERCVRAVLADLAVPKPSRISEHYAALTLSIVLLRELIMPENTPKDRKIAVEVELEDLLKKRSELEQDFESNSSTEGGA